MDSLAVLPYDQRLHRFPAYLQQLEMESNGKRTTLDGKPSTYDTGAVIWGEPGSNAQHSFFQLLHQGTARVALDFLAPVNASSPYQQQQNLALANCFAQAQAFAFGQTEEQVRSGSGEQRACRSGDRAPHSAQGPSRQSPELGHSFPAPRPQDARPADRALRAQGVHPERDLGHQRVRPVGRRAGQEAGGFAGAGGRESWDRRCISRGLLERVERRCSIR